MTWQETHTPDNFQQGLQVGDEAVFVRTGDQYISPGGWEEIPVKVRITGFDYPTIKTTKGGFHYSRFRKREPQLKLF